MRLRRGNTHQRFERRLYTARSLVHDVRDTYTALRRHQPRRAAQVDRITLPLAARWKMIPDGGSTKTFICTMAEPPDPGPEPARRIFRQDPCTCVERRTLSECPSSSVTASGWCSLPQGFWAVVGLYDGCR